MVEPSSGMTRAIAPIAIMPDWHNQPEPLLAETSANKCSIHAPPIRSSRCSKGSCNVVPAITVGTLKWANRWPARPALRRDAAINLVHWLFSGFGRRRIMSVTMSFTRLVQTVNRALLVAAPMFRDFMKGALAGCRPTPFRVAQGIEEVPVDHRSVVGSSRQDTPGSILGGVQARN